MLPGGILMGIMSPITGRLFDRFGAKWLSIIGLVLIANTLWQFSGLTPETPYAFIMVMNTLLMLGISMMMMPVMTNALNSLPPKLYTHGTAILSTLQQVSGAIGTALLVTVMSNRSASFLAEAGVDAASDPATGMAAMMAGMKSAFLIAFALVVTALVLTLLLKRANRPSGEGEAAPQPSH